MRHRSRRSRAELTIMHVVEPIPVYEPVMAGGGSYSGRPARLEASMARLRGMRARHPRVECRRDRQAIPGFFSARRRSGAT
jgi:hypothetical protein